MKKLKLQLDSKHMLTKEQMKKATGGYYMCPNGQVYVSGFDWWATFSCSEAQSAYNGHATATWTGGGEGEVTGYCCATCPTSC